MLKWSSIRNGEKFRNSGVPIERRTRAPAPSACSMARKALRITRGTDIFEVIVGSGMRGGPSKIVGFVVVVLFSNVVK